MIDGNLTIIRGLLSAEREAGPPANELQETQARIRRNTINQLMEAIEAELQPIREGIKSLPALPPEQVDEEAERKLRDAVLDTALWYLTDGDYHAGSSPEARAAAIKGLLEDDEQEEREEADPVPHAVIREVVPDVLDHGILRLWFVQIGGDWNACEVGLIRYNPDGNPEFITMEPEDSEDDEE